MKKRIIIISLIALFVDLLTKFVVFSSNRINTAKSVIKGFFYILPTKNNGAAFSSFAGYQIFLILISLAILTYLIYISFKQQKGKLSTVSYGLLIGGLLGNLFDRIVFHYVRDFISIHLFKYEFAIFNIADICIVVGAIILIWLSFVGDKKYEN